MYASRVSRLLFDGPGDTSSEKSTAELRRQHDELDRLIGERESE